MSMGAGLQSTRRYLRRLAADEHGSNAVEYLGVTILGLILAGLIIAAISQSRTQIGAAMAVILDRQITSFEAGLGGTANTDAALYPTVRSAALVPPRALRSAVVAVPRVVSAVTAQAVTAPVVLAASIAAFATLSLGIVGPIRKRHGVRRSRSR